MSKPIRHVILGLALIVAGAWAGGCGAPPTPAPTSQPQPTAAPAAPASTEIAPTAMPAGSAPAIVGLSDQTISDGERFPAIDLDEHVTDADHAPEDISWQVSGNIELGIRLIGSNLIISLPTVDWTGAETLQFEACDPDDLCATQEVTFTVVEENDAPVLSINDQILVPGESFTEIVLERQVHDEDHTDDELTWTYSGNVDLDVQIAAGVVTIAAPDAAWAGREMIQFQACDPLGACGTQDVTFWVMERSGAEVEVTYVGNAGFLIRVGETKIVVDAFFRGLGRGYALPDEIVERIENAQPPFDGVDLILVSHNHADHVDAALVRQHMENNPEAILVAPNDVVGALPSPEEVQEQTIAIRQGQTERQFLLDEIGLQTMYISHGGDILNLGFVITVEGYRFFHTGDQDPETVGVPQLRLLGLPDKRIDVAFVAHFILITEEYHAIITSGIQARYIVPIHYHHTVPGVDYDLMEFYFPDAIVFYEELESWVMPQE